MSAVALKREDLPHYTYDDYVQWEGKWEIIHGIPYAMTPSPKKKHQWISSRISRQLHNQLNHCEECDILMPVDWPITEDTVVQPDILVVCGESLEGAKLENTPLVIFEILSPSTSKKDRGLKYELYQNAGVKYYCIVDPETLSIEAYVLQQDRYSRADGSTGQGISFDLETCQVYLDLETLFQRLR